ncbi:xylanase [Capsulimonas corticalis]|uniref:Xylanase n=1 Tax=Capsulimonas corticalis TaxID=2219043 RepID=A0A9N7KZL5_9BACT|nr:alpha/beta hydrolase [Capsulimonas corticalis]BDI28148.1 xylanase [Capsulimonas corticalis]
MTITNQMAPADPPAPTFDLWPATAPGEQSSSPGKISDDHGGNVLRLTDVTQPQLQLFPAEGKGPHPAVLVLPGGGYSILAIDLEGTEVAAWLNKLGFTVAVLTYRVPDKRDAAFQDGQRAISLLRARAKEFGIDPKHLGVLGFSAGGHLTARLATGYAARSYTPVDAADQQSDRPDFAALIYPAYLFDSATGLPAPEVKPHAGMPPIFLTQTLDDGYLTAPAYATALEQAGVPVHGAYYLKGGHGYGLRAPADQPVHGWADAAGAWLKEQIGKKR